MERPWSFREKCIFVLLSPFIFGLIGFLALTGWQPVLCGTCSRLDRERKKNPPVPYHERIIRRIENPWPPVRKRRALSVCIEHETPAQKKTVGQVQSPFLTRLPWELRQRIYEFVLGRLVVHLRVEEPSDRHCYVERPLTGHSYSNRFGRVGALRGIHEWDWPRPLSIPWWLMAHPLLKTCRQIYMEAVNTLYTANTFILNSQFILSDLPSFLLPQRIQHIRHLRLVWDPSAPPRYTTFMVPEHRGDFQSSMFPWEVLKRMTGLRDLHIRMKFFEIDNPKHQRVWDDLCRYILAPIKSITAPERFVVVLPSRKCATDIDVGLSSCVFELPEGGNA